MATSKSSLTWSFFKKVSPSQATCNYCHQSIKCGNGNTSGMRRHLLKHPTEHDKPIKAEKERHDKKIADLSTTTTSKRIRDQPTLQEVASRFEKYGPNSQQQQKFDTSMVDMLACTGTAFNWVEHPKTKKLFDVSNPKYTVKSRKHILNT